jgi:hypothetical protein
VRRVPRGAFAFVSGLIAAAIGSAALAQAPAQRPPPSPEAIATARAEADKLIASARAGDLFENVTDGAIPAVRHRASGLKCGFGPRPDGWDKDSLAVFTSGLPRGADVGCIIHFEGYVVSLDASRQTRTPTLDAMTAYYVKSVLAQHPHATPYVGPYVEPSGLKAGFPAFQSVRLSLDEPGGRQFSRLSVAVVRGWVIEERVTGPYDDAQFGDLLATNQLLGAIVSVQGADAPKRP